MRGQNRNNCRVRNKLVRNGVVPRNSGAAGPPQNGGPRPVLILGGAGFIGTNLADRLLKSNRPVMVYDNLSRPGVERNLDWLQEMHGGNVRIEMGDICDRPKLRKALQGAEQVFHFAAQVAVTTSIASPLHDFTVNALGTVTLLEELRALEDPPPLVFTSTNKVYGGLKGLDLQVNCKRYEPVDPFLRLTGINERCPLDFYSPYGCSKGAADQYVIDYARTYGLPAAVFRMSCIYGPHQFGTEDQGWVAHFLISAIEGRPLTIYGDGMQVRDILFIDDLIDAFLLVQENIRSLSGQAFNIGGGPSNVISLLELLELVKGRQKETPAINFADWRPGDQRYYVSDSKKFAAATGWAPKVSAARGVGELYNWLLDSRRVSSEQSAGEKEHYEVCLD